MKSKLRLSFLHSLGGQVEVGDFVGGGRVYDKATAHIANKYYGFDESIFIDSFAPRDNLGSQPMGDDFPVVVELLEAFSTGETGQV